MQFPTENVNLATSLIEEAKLPLNEKEKEFIQKSCDESSDRFFVVVSELYSSKLLTDALDKHAKALEKSAKASEKQASGLKWASWALVFVTVMLVIATLIPRLSLR